MGQSINIPRQDGNARFDTLQVKLIESSSLIRTVVADNNGKFYYSTSGGGGGTTGTNGTSGTSGINGANGTNGTSGTTGTSGTSGVSGAGFNAIANPLQGRVLLSDGSTNSASASFNLFYDTGSSIFKVTGSLIITGSSSNTTYLLDASGSSRLTTLHIQNLKNPAGTSGEIDVFVVGNPGDAGYAKLTILAGGSPYSTVLRTSGDGGGSRSMLLDASGPGGEIYIGTSNVNRWIFSGTYNSLGAGHILPVASATYNIGDPTKQINNYYGVSNYLSGLLNVTGSATISGSLRSLTSVFLPGLTQSPQASVVLVDSSTGQLYYTASSALISTSASYASTASYALFAVLAATASYVDPANLNLTLFQIATGSVTASVNTNPTNLFLIKSGSTQYFNISSSGDTDLYSNLFIVRNFTTQQPVLIVSQSIVQIQTQSLNPIGTTNAGSIWFTSSSFYVGLE
jgi:hypothetical protein